MENDEEILPALGFLATGITAMLTRISRETLTPFNLTPVETAILFYCSRNLATTTQRLVGAIHMDQASISRHIAKLVAKGLIRRTRPCEDRRVVRLELTEKGWAAMPRLLESHQYLNSLVNLGIGGEEKRIFLDTTRKIHKNLQVGLQDLGTATAGKHSTEPKNTS
ncbi:MAG: MarR family winged helix-turn-helix transcriptional regulator [bacterium]|nr:MarR family winged helix-turn-helix transcriptional regulator [bacterium]